MNNISKFKFLGLFGLLIFNVVSCTKEIPYKKITLFDMQSKAGISQGVDHLMVVSNSGLDMEAPAIAYEMSQAERVQFIYREHSLDVIKVPNDGKFTGNLSNNKLMVSIPISYIDTKCTEDSFGECTNVEQINEDIPWNEKSFFKPEVKNTTTPGLLSLSITMDNYFGGSCHIEQGSKLKSYKIEPGAVNFVIEKTYRTASHCTASLERLDKVTFTVNRHYSIIELDKLITKDYKALPFKSDEDENQFGFFRTHKKEVDESNQDTHQGNSEFQNRWAPGKTIVYYLNKEFNEIDSESPKLNSNLKKATYHAFEIINEGLKSINSSIQIELREPKSELQVGDIRNNDIIMVHDPISRGLLGYGPSITNPDNGEIIYARTVMYKGVMKKTIKGAYDDLIKGKIRLKAIDSRINPEEINISQNEIKNSLIKNFLDLKSDKLFTEDFIQQMPLIDFPRERQNQQKYNSLSNTIFHENQSSIFNQPERFKSLIDDEKRSSLMEVYSRNNFYSVEVFNTHSIIEQKLDQLINDFGELKLWKQLSKNQRQKAINTILPFVWVPTLVHELGHNLGLRHNFKGSFDKANFYSEAELETKGINRKVQYSSIMDYAYGTQNELSILGKYDLAAFRYAYGSIQSYIRDERGLIKQNSTGEPLLQTSIGAVEVVEASEDLGGFLRGSERILPIGSYALQQAFKRGLILKPYQFCTDEHVSSNPTCNRFDEGTTATEVVQHFENAWKEGYERRNLRNNRYNFNSFDGDLEHISYLRRSMDALRQNFEFYETIKRSNNIPNNDERWTSVPFLKETKAAAELAGQVLLNIIKTPDVHCMIQNTNQPNSKPLVISLRSISTHSSSCYSLKVPSQYKVIAQAGKSLRNIKDMSNPDSSIIQIDTRGIWIDKMMALKSLVEKNNNRIDEYHENFTALPALKKPINDLLSNLIIDQHFGDLNFDNGQILKNRPYSLTTKDSHMLKAPLHIGIQYFFMLPDHTISFQKAMLNMIAQLTQPIENLSEEKLFYNNFIVYKNDLPSELQNDIKQIRFNNEVYVATPSNTIALRLMKYINHLTEVRAGLNSFRSIPDEEIKIKSQQACIEIEKINDKSLCEEETTKELINNFNKERPQQLSQIILSRIDNADSESEITDDEASKNLYKLDLEILLAELNQQTKEIKYYKNMLESLNIY